MAHLIETMAYAGVTPWHGLGNQLTQKQPIEVWQREAGMDWAIQESPVHFKAELAGHLGSIHSFPEQKVLYRSDTKAPLSVVSQRYHTVQPAAATHCQHLDLFCPAHRVRAFGIDCPHPCWDSPFLGRP